MEFMQNDTRIPTISEKAKPGLEKDILAVWNPLICPFELPAVLLLISRKARHVSLNQIFYRRLLWRESIMAEAIKRTLKKSKPDRFFEEECHAGILVRKIYSRISKREVRIKEIVKSSYMIKQRTNIANQEKRPSYSKKKESNSSRVLQYSSNILILRQC